jgi:hypothetical protein
MINRTLKYLKNIKFNSLLSKTIIRENKKKNLIIQNQVIRRHMIKQYIRHYKTIYKTL